MISFVVNQSEFPSVLILNLIPLPFAEGGGEAKGERKREVSKHRSFYGGAEARAGDEGKAKSRT